MKTFSKTDVGRMREMNQDFVLVSDQPIGNLPNLLIVADGMGGHNAGDFASKYVANAVMEGISKSKETSPKAAYFLLAFTHVPLLC